MMRRCILLTTDTTHHAFFARELAAVGALDAVIVEEPLPPPSFETHHPFEDERDAYEREEFFDGATPNLADLAACLRVTDVNSAEVVGQIQRTDSAVIVFGTRKIGGALLTAAAGRILNLHGGDPELYRGLDSHLWAIYHGDRAALVTTLHVLNPELDDGEVVLQEALPLVRDLALHQLRSVNARTCVNLTKAALAAWEAVDPLPSRPQRARGRYYSWMPAELKELCVHRFGSLLDDLD